MRIEAFGVAALVVGCLGAPPREVAFEFPEGSEAAAGLLAEPDTPVEVRVRVTEAGAPRPGSRVTMAGLPDPLAIIPESALTGDDGLATFYFLAPQGSFALIAASSQEASATARFERETQDATSATLAIEFHQGSPASEGVLEPTDRSLLDFSVVVTAGGVPRPGVMVALHTVPMTSVVPTRAATDAAGRIAANLEVPSDAESLLIRAVVEDAGVTGEVSARLNAPTVTAPELAFVFPPGSPAATGRLAPERRLIAGQVVVTRDGEPAGGEQVRIESTPELTIIPANPTTGHDGTASFYLVSPERPSVTVGTSTQYIEAFELVLLVSAGDSDATAILTR